MVNGVFLSLSKAQKVSISSTTAKNATALASDKVMIWSSVDCYIAFGSSAVEATTSSIPIPAGTVLFLHNPGATYIAGICDTGVSGTLNIVECS